MTADNGPTWDDERLRRDRLARVQAQMRQRNVGALLLADGSKCRYVLNVQIPGVKVYLPAEGTPLAIVRPRDIGYVRLEYPNVRLP
ncbi:MAG: hypothetical protein HW416_3983 [Chloroflexi bacterium]|nr:hypothetical protein [Chloroflexota bacterium]